MAERKAYAPPVPETPPYVSPEEIAAASRPATGTLDRRGGAIRIENIPAAPVPSASQADVRKAEPAEAAAATPAAPSTFPGLPGLPTGAPAAAPGGDITPYESTSPSSRYDKDIEFTHTLSRMLGMAGLGEKASGMRDLNMKLQAARIDDVGANAQRAFLAGDITKGIDMFNHVVPNGQKITGYRRNQDGSVALQMADGRVENRSPSEIADTLTTFRNPEVMGAMMKDRAKTLAVTNQKLALTAYKASMDLYTAIAKGKINHQNAMELEKLKAQLGADRITVGMDGTPWIAQRGGGVMSLKMGKNPLTGKPEWQQDQIIEQQGLGNDAAAPTGGTSIDQTRVPLTVAAPYR